MLFRESVARRCYVKKMSLKVLQSFQENNSAGVSAILLKKILAQVFFCEFCNFVKNIYFLEHLQTAASELQ